MPLIAMVGKFPKVTKYFIKSLIKLIYFIKEVLY